MEKTFTSDEWRAAKKEDFTITEEQREALKAEMNALRDIAKEFGAPIHIQIVTGHSGDSCTLMGTSSFHSPARLPIEMLASHIAAVEGAAKALEFLAEEAEYQSAGKLFDTLLKL